MPKQKTSKCLTKRLKVSGTGKVIARRAGKSHLLSSKSSKRRRNKRRQMVLSGAMARKIRSAMGE